MRIFKKQNKINQTVTESDLFAFIDDVFPDNPKGWKEATDELPTMVEWISDNGSLVIPEGKSKTPKEFNTKNKNLLRIGFPTLDNHHKNLFFEQFGEWITNWKLKKISEINSSYGKVKNKKLFESEQQLFTDLEDSSNDDEIESVMSLKKNQFIFESGVFLASIPTKLNTKFCLFWHAINTSNVTEFIESVVQFIDITNETITDLDIERLELHYNKYFIE